MIVYTTFNDDYWLRYLDIKQTNEEKFMKPQEKPFSEQAEVITTSEQMRRRDEYKATAKRVVGNQLKCLSETLDNFYFILQNEESGRAFHKMLEKVRDLIAVELRAL